MRRDDRLLRLLRDVLLPAAVYGVATAFFTWPLPAVATTEIFDGSARGAAFAVSYRIDMLHIIWILRWNLHALVTDPLHLFDANIFHPAPLSLARAEYLLGGVPLFGAVWAPSQNPVLAFNSYMLASFVLAGFCMHVLVRRMTGSEAAAYVAGLAFAFAPWRIPDGLGRTQLLQVQYLPLIVLTLDRVATSGRLRDALLAAGVVILQAISCFYLGQQAFLVAGAFVLVDLVWRGVRGRGQVVGMLLAALTLALVGVMAAAFPYLVLRTRGELTMVSDPLWRLTTVMGTPFMIARRYVGPGTVVLAVAGLAWLLRPRTIDQRGIPHRLVFLLIGVLGFALARGPAPWFGDRIVPYDWLQLIPGFGNIRVPARFGIVASFGVSGLAGFAVADILGWLRRTTTWHTALGLAVGAAGSFVVLAPLMPLPRLRGWPVPAGATVPSVYRWLAAHGAGRPLLELPMGGYNTNNALAIYFSTYHWLPLLNGYGSYFPPSYRFVEERAARLPDPQALQELVDCTGVGWVLVHRAAPRDEQRWQTLPGIRLHAVFPREAGRSDRLYDVVATPRPCAAEGFGGP